ncbi:SIR2 family protein [Candidatus Bathyarchaeota archaeon]|nr:SIR2 family protein [Candidatus Bathyarchaeota archaeon]
MNLTLFVGAGFSAAFGHPVMDTFLEFADSCKNLQEEDRSFLGRLVLEARRANSFLESSPTNIEDILSFSQMGERLGLTEDGENRNRHLLEIIQKIYTTILSPPEYWQKYQCLKKLIGAEPSDFKGTLSFVTTNYDLNIECTCSLFQTSVNPGFEPRRVKGGNVQTVSNFYGLDKILLYKLHGSVNWYRMDNEPDLVVEDRIVALHYYDDRQPRSLPFPYTDKYKAPGIPVIVPPSFLKPDLPKELKDVWSGAAQVLSKANIVAFIGYSFPFSDTDMMFFLARALSENTGLRKVYLVDPRAETIAARLRDPSSKIGSHFRSLLQPIARGWTEVALPL